MHSDTPKSFFESYSERGAARATLLKLEHEARKRIRESRDPLLRGKKARSKASRIRDLLKQAREQNPENKTLAKITKLLSEDAASLLVAPENVRSALDQENRRSIELCKKFIKSARHEFHEIAVAAARETRGRNGGVYKGTRKFGNTLCGVSCVQHVALEKVGGGDDGDDDESPPDVSQCTEMLGVLKERLDEKTTETKALTNSLRALSDAVSSTDAGADADELHRLMRDLRAKLSDYHDSCYSPLGLLMRNLAEELSSWSALYRGLISHPLPQMHLPSSVMDTWGIPPHLCKGGDGE